MNLKIPPMAKTHDSIAVIWEKPADWQEVKEYQVYLNGKVAATVSTTDYTFERLIPDTQYEIQVFALSHGKSLLEKSERVKAKTKKAPRIYNVVDYGAVGDGKTLNTQAIQKAIDACEQEGMVYIPEGVFLSGAIFLKSNMSLYVEEGGKLLGSTNPQDYPVMHYRYEGAETFCFASLINSKEQEQRHENITILGPGEINGSGSELLRNELENGSARRGCVICLRNTDYLYMKDIKVRQSPFWCIHPIYCSHISINHIEVNTKYDENGKRYENIVNGDGVDLDSCRDAYVFNSFISSQDDCLAVKSGSNEEGRRVGICSENIRISNCRFKAGFGVAMGSDMSGGIRNVLVQDCFFEDSFSIASVKTRRGRGACIENVLYDNCALVNKDRDMKSCKWFKGALYLDYYYGEDYTDHEKAQEISEETPLIKDITFQNISIYTEEGNAIYLAGLPESNARNICFENIEAIGRNGFFAVNVDGLKVHHVSVKALEGKDMEFARVKGFQAE